MTRRLIVVLVLRVLGLLWLVNALGGLSLLVSMAPAALADPPDGTGPILWTNSWAFYQFLVVGSAALVCLVNTHWLARKLFPEFGEEPVSISTAELGVLAFRFLGVGTVVHGASGVVRAAVEVFWGLGGPRRAAFGDVFRVRWPNYLESVVMAIAGATLFLYAARLAEPRPENPPEVGER